MNTKEDNITADPHEHRSKAQEVLDRIKAKHAKLEFVRIPIENGYKEVEKRKYERLIREGQLAENLKQLTDYENHSGTHKQKNQGLREH